jgi:hypothetical protein
MVVPRRFVWLQIRRADLQPAAAFRAVRQVDLESAGFSED